MKDQKSTKKTSAKSSRKKVDNLLAEGFRKLAKVTPVSIERPILSTPPQPLSFEDLDQPRKKK